MIRRYDKRNYHSVGMVIDNSDEEESLEFCSPCAANGVMSKLKERLYLDSAGKRLPPPPDAEDWLQCWVCGLIIATRDTKKLGKISGIQGIETTDNKFDYGKSSILGNDSKNRYQRLKQRKTKHPDAEVQRMLEGGYELKSYQQDVPVSNNDY